MSQNQSPRETALAKVHSDLGATFTDFAGWNMPVRYTSDLEEHHAVRKSAGLFDLSHMGEIRLTGPDAGAALDWALAGKLSSVSVGRAKYTLLLAEDGGVLDDLIVYRLGETEYLVVANASNAEQDFAAIKERAEKFDVAVVDESAETALIAVQGPASEAILLQALVESGQDTGLSAEDLTGLGYYRWLGGKFGGSDLLVARTGYTGEDGFELYVPVAQAEALWQLLTEVGGDKLQPCGLACRDTLRLEAGMPLYGHELNAETVPAQAGLGPVVAMKSKPEFFGRSGIENTDVSTRRRLVGLVSEGRRAGRAGYPVTDATGKVVGEVTSGALSPTLGYPIAMAYVDPEFTEPGTELAIDVRGKALPAQVVALPFYKREEK